MRAGIFDSGIGGLTVTSSLIDAKIFEEIVYYGDTARVPYGTKDKNTIISYSLEAVEFFKNFDLDILIIACNTVSAFALDEIKNSIDIPVVGVIESGVLALQQCTKKKNANILVIGTQATIDSGLYEHRLNKLKYKNINSLATPLFVPLVEEGIFKGDILKETMKMYFKNTKHVDVIILGCTHFPLIEKEISNFLGNAKTIHSGDAILEFLQENYSYNKTYKKTKISFFASSNPDKLKKIAKKWLNKDNYE